MLVSDLIAPLTKKTPLIYSHLSLSLGQRTTSPASVWNCLIFAASFSPKPGRPERPERNTDRTGSDRLVLWKNKSGNLIELEITGKQKDGFIPECIDGWLWVFYRKDSFFLYSSPRISESKKSKKKNQTSNGKSQASFPGPLICLVGRFVNKTFQPVSFLLHLTLPDDPPMPGAPNRSIPGCPTIRCRAFENEIRNLPQKWTPWWIERQN